MQDWRKIGRLSWRWNFLFLTQLPEEDHGADEKGSVGVVESANRLGESAISAAPLRQEHLTTLRGQPEEHSPPVVGVRVRFATERFPQVGMLRYLALLSQRWNRTFCRSSSWLVRGFDHDLTTS